MTATMIPTVGRKVYFFRDKLQREPHDATIIKVYSPPDHATHFTCVNLLVVDPDTGVTRLETNMQSQPAGTPWAHFEWMPYQVNQALKSAREDAAAQPSASLIPGL